LSARPGDGYVRAQRACPCPVAKELGEPVELLTSPRADELSVLLEQINVRSVVYCLSDLGAPWGLQVDASATAKFHLVLDGRATLTLAEPGAAPAELSAGDLALLPHGSGHVLRDDIDSPVRPLEHIVAEAPAGTAERLAYGGDGPRTSLLCGGFALAPGRPENLLGLLPPLLVLDTAEGGINRWLEPTLALLRNEIASDAPGGPAMLAKLADVFLAEIARRYLSSLDVLTISAPSAAADDPSVGAALALIRAQPDAPWTVADLARKVGLSRTAFAARFRELVGEPPMSYLARVRLSYAAGYLSATDKTVRQIARMVGYQNEASLSKAFRRAFGRAPGEYRRQQQAAHGVRATFAGTGPHAVDGRFATPA
jgi:AraC-like DNA-binding protein